MRFLSWIWVQGVGVDRKIKRAGFLAVVCLGVLPAHGQDATWDSAPGSGDWNTATNWSPATVPTGTATFGSSNTTAITFSAASTTVGEMLFNAGAPAYTFTFIELGTQTLTITGAGIVNNSSHRPTFSPGVLIPSTSFVDTLQFQNSSTAGNAIITDYPGGQTDFFNTSTAGNATITSRANFAANGIIDFFDASTAGNATITNSSLKSAGNKTGLTEFHDTSTAANATITNNTNGFTDFFDTSTAGHASITNNQVGITIFQDTSTAANATITTTFAGALTEFLDASTAGNAIITNSGGNTLFQGTSTAGNATIITNSQDGRASRTDFLGTSTAGNANLTINSGGVTSFQGTSTAGNSTITTNSGGVTAFEDTSTGGNARLVTNAGGIVDISSLSSGGITVGSIAGAGNYRLGAKTLTVGLNNLSTEVSGTIADGGIAGGTGGALTKVGTGTLTLSGANTYTGNTEVDAGGLLVTGSLGATQVTVASGASLGGSGKIAGPVTVLNGGILAPGDPATLRVGPLTLNSGSILNYQLGVPNIVGSGTNDLVIVNGKLTLAGTLNITNAGGFGGGVYRLFNYTGSLTNNGLAFGTLPAGFTATDLLLQTSQAGQINLVVSATGSTDQFWDGTTTTGDGTIHGGSGTWNNVTTNWTNLDGKINAPWNNGFAIFSGTAGTVTLGANINFIGMQFMTDGYVIAAPGARELMAAVGTIIRVDSGVTATISAPIVDQVRVHADITKTDLGTLILTGDNTYSGGTTVESGTLVVDSANALGAGNVTVTGGVLTADPQPINVVGNYFQGPNGTLQLQVAGAGSGQYDYLNVSGNATLGGTLQLINQSFVPQPGDTLTLVKTGGVITNKFANFIDPFNTRPGLNTIDLVYSADSVDLEFLNILTSPPVTSPPTIVTTINFTSFAKTPNELAAAELLDAIELRAGAGSLINFFLGQPFGNIPGDLAVIGPQSFTSFYEISFSGANLQRLNLENRLDEIRLDGGTFDTEASGGTVGLQRSSSTEVSLYQSDGKTPKNPVEPVLQPIVKPRFDLWASGYGDFVNVDSDYNARGYRFTTSGFDLGFDYRFLDHFAVGVMGNYAYTWTDLRPGTIAVNSGRGGLYGSYFNGNYYVNAGVYGGYNTYDTNRSGLFGNAIGNTAGEEWSGFISTGYDFHTRKNLTIGPVASLQYTNVYVTGFTEQGSLVPLSIHSASEESLRTDLGFRASYQWQVGRTVIEPYVKAEWEHEFKYSALPVTASLAQFPGPDETFFGPAEGQDSAVLSAGVSVQWTPAVSTFVGYDGQLGRGRYSSNAVNGGVRVSW